MHPVSIKKEGGRSKRKFAAPSGRIMPRNGNSPQLITSNNTINISNTPSTNPINQNIDSPKKLYSSPSTNVDAMNAKQSSAVTPVVKVELISNPIKKEKIGTKRPTMVRGTLVKRGSEAAKAVAKRANLDNGFCDYPGCNYKTTNKSHPNF